MFLGFLEEIPCEPTVGKGIRGEHRAEKVFAEGWRQGRTKLFSKIGASAFKRGTIREPLEIRSKFCRAS